MKQLIEITPSLVGDERIQTVNARDLHSFLESKQKFTDWMKNRIDDYGFVEDEDYFLLHKFMKQTGSGGHNKIEYFISIDMAKELSMVERSEKGKQARQYFIACEKQLKSTNRASVAHLKYRLQLIDKLEKERNSIKRNAIYEQLQLVSDSVGLSTPDIDSIGFVSAYEELLNEFWEFYNENKNNFNHSSNHHLIAINMNEILNPFIKYRGEVVTRSTLQQALQSSIIPKYMDNKTVYSRISDNKSVRCYVFENSLLD